MNNFAIFIVGIVVTLITGMGVLTSLVSLGYKKQQVKVIPKFAEPPSSAQIPSPS